ncbi:class I adenylate-forming enzyme family protein [Aquibium microcysteis]|uniref:class I adenylate-forming enzyme family protein n=1 Tax=Aquibium microcysteis TaxID=675281 RepID=UPI00165D16C4|nr:class I adenylate-forming enzyme family protein [Aquibium microcysteis]
MRLPLILDLAADTFGDRIAIDGDGGRLTVGDLRSASRGLAEMLARRPISAVGYLGVNGPSLPVALFGAAIAGIPFTPLNYRLSDDALRRLAARLAPALIVADADMAPRLRGIQGIDLWQSASLCELGSSEYTGVEGSETAVKLFTSGTTGEPKAALLSHANLTAYVFQSVDFASAGEDEAALLSVPPYHIAGISALITSLYSGRRNVQLSAFEEQAWVDAAKRHRVTHAMLVPTMLGRILDVIEDQSAAPARLRAIAYGGGRMPRPVIERALRLLPGVSFTNAYGLTETSSTICVLGPDDHDAARSGDPAAVRRLDSVGRPLPGIEIEIRDADGSACATGIAGEVFVRGDQVSGRYAEQGETKASGWFATRDRGWLDTDGCLYLDGRLDDVIVRGGENISPGEIEDALRRHPAIADAAVVGAPDSRWGERIAAFVALRDGASATETQLRDHVRGILRSTKVPEDIHFRDGLPYNEAGKLLRRILRDELSHR